MPSPTVLVVDDDPHLREILHTVLAGEGYQVSTAADGEQALGRTEGGLIDIIVMDVTMPHLTGLQACYTLRQRGDHTPVLLLSGRAAGSDRAAGLAAGANDYSTTPFDLDTLLAHVHALAVQRAGLSRWRLLPPSAPAAPNARNPDELHTTHHIRLATPTPQHAASPRDRPGSADAGLGRRRVPGGGDQRGDRDMPNRKCTYG